MASRSAAGVSDAALAAAGVAPRRGSGAARKGSHYKARSKEWLERQGYAVAHLERMMWIRRGGPPCGACGQPQMFATKKDQMASDLLAVRCDEIVFVQVKLGEKSVLPARREFLRFPFPPQAQRHIHVWTAGARAPDVIDCTGDTPGTVPERRTRARTERLF